MRNRMFGLVSFASLAIGLVVVPAYESARGGRWDGDTADLQSSTASAAGSTMNIPGNGGLQKKKKECLVVPLFSVADPDAESDSLPGGFPDSAFPSSVSIETGSVYEFATDIEMATVGPAWSHVRSYDSTLDAASAGSETCQGLLWRHNLIPELTVDVNQDVTVIIDSYGDVQFDYDSGTQTYAAVDFEPMSLAHDAVAGVYLLKADDQTQWRFRDFSYTVAEEQGKLYEVRDAYDNAVSIYYSSGQIDHVDDAGGHRMTYSYINSGDNVGKLETIKLYTTTSETATDLMGQVDYEYYDDINTNGGQIGDLQLVTSSRRATGDADGTLSMVDVTHYRYWSGAYESVSNPGTNHRIKYILRGSDYVRFDSEYDYLTATDAQVADYATTYFEYDSSYRVNRVSEHGGCASCGGGSGTPGTSTLTWSIRPTTPTNYNSWNVHCQVDRSNDTRVYVDVNIAGKILTKVFEDRSGTSPYPMWIEHYDYTAHNRLYREHKPSSCSNYTPASPDLIAFRLSSGFITEYEYFGAGDFEDYLKAVKVKKGGIGTPVKTIEYGRTLGARPDIVTSVTKYQSADSGGSSGVTTSYSYTFHDASSKQVNTITTTYPIVTTDNNGPGVASVAEQYFDATGNLRWERDGEGYVTYYGYDVTNGGGTFATGRQTLQVTDVNTQILPTVVSNEWTGAAPLLRTGAGSALSIVSTTAYDAIGRVRKEVAPGGAITWTAYKDGETRVYPVWNGATCKCDIPARITKRDADGHPLEVILLKTTASIGTANGEPDGSETLTQGNFASWTRNEYNSSGQLDNTKKYHAVPTSGDGSRYGSYYQTDYVYDSMGRLEYVFEDVAAEIGGGVEQVRQYVCDIGGRRIETKMGVSDASHDASNHSVPATMVTVSSAFYDDTDGDDVPEQGVGDGNLSYTLDYFGSGVNDHTVTEHRYDWRNRRCVTLPDSGPIQLEAYDNLDRVVAIATFASTNALEAGGDPTASALASNRLSLSKTFLDQEGRVYKSQRFLDPSDAIPTDALTTNRYCDRRGKVWAVDAPNRGVRFTKYDGAGRQIAKIASTQFDTTKYDETNHRPDYPDNNEGIIEYTAFTLDATGRTITTVHREINHDDSDGINLTVPFGGASDHIRTFVHEWYDDAGRNVATADYGTMNAMGWKYSSFAPYRPTTPPASSDTCLVTTYDYDDSGRLDTTTDAKNIVRRTEFDDLGRKTAEIEDYGTGKLNRRTAYAYNGQDSLVSITAVLDVDQVTGYEYCSGVNSRWVTKIKFPATDTDGGKTVGQPSDETYDRIVFSYNRDGAVATRTDQNGTVLTYEYDSKRRKNRVIATTVGNGVDDSVRAVSWTYNDLGKIEYVTTHSDVAPDVTNWSDAVTQVKNTYDGSGYLTKQEQAVDGSVTTGTASVEFGYESDFVSGNYKRLRYVKYPDGKRVFRGYTHSDSGSTIQDEINNQFNRVGQLAFEGATAGTIGDVIAEYDFNGIQRMVRRNHSAGTGLAGNNTRLDLWHGTSGVYAGLDRFGRNVDMKHTGYSGTATDFDRRKYTYDRSGNPTSIENGVFRSRSQVLTYDDLDRLTSQDEGILVDASGAPAIAMSDLSREYNMDLLGNLTSNSGGFKQNSAAITVSHAVNASNEIASISHPNPAGRARLLFDDFADASLNTGVWTQGCGVWSITSGKLVVDSLDDGAGGQCDLVTVNGSAITDDGTYEAKVTLNSILRGKTGGIYFSKVDYLGTEYLLAVLLDTAGTDGTVTLRRITITGGTSSDQILATTTGAIAVDTEYTIRIRRIQRRVEVDILNSAGTAVVASMKYDSPDDFGDGSFGMLARCAGVKFDDFSFTRLDQLAPAVPNWAASAKTELVAEAQGYSIRVESAEWGGEVKLAMVGDDDYLAQADIDLNSGVDGELMFRYTDPDNHYAVRLDSSGTVKLIKVVRGKETTVASNSYSITNPIGVKVSASGSAIKVSVGGVVKINTTDSDLTSGTVALAGEKAIFDNVRVGYDLNADDTIDNYIVDESFDSMSVAVTHDYAGNLTYDGTYRYTYDAWNRLVQATLADANVTIQAARYDGLGRRVRKTVTNSGKLDSVSVYYFNRKQIIEARDDAGNLELQVYHGTRYIDEIVGMRLPYGRVYVHQDANFNVIDITDLTGRQLERCYYSPYGELEVVHDAHFFDYDDDGDVDSSDAAVVASGGSCRSNYSGECMRMDVDSDRDIDADDYNAIVAYVDTLSDDTKLQRIPATTISKLGNLFGHQGLVFDGEIGSYQNRARQYAPRTRRFMQRDPLSLRPKAAGGYQDGLSLFGALGSSPLHIKDPIGLTPLATSCTQGKIYKTSYQLPCYPCGKKNCKTCRKCVCDGTVIINLGEKCGACAIWNPPAAGPCKNGSWTPSPDCCACWKNPTEEQCRDCCLQMGELLTLPQARKTFQQECMTSDAWVDMP